MLEFVVIDTNMISIGSKLIANSKADRRGICQCNEVVTVIKIKVEDQPYIGVYSDCSHSLWGTLDGNTEDHRGIWLEGNSIFKYFSLISDNITINKDFKFKNKNLKGMNCKILHQDKRNNQYFVEFIDNIGGGSADGMGKTGHCVVLPGNLFENDKKNKAEQNPFIKSFNLNGILEESNQFSTQEHENPDFLNQLADTTMEVFNKAKLKIIQTEYETNGESPEFLNKMSKITTKAHDKVRLKMKKVEMTDILGIEIPEVINNMDTFVYPIPREINDGIPIAMTNDFWTEENFNTTIPEDIEENCSEEEYES